MARYDCYRAIRTLSCAEQFRMMAFAQLTYGESLHDIEACLSVQSAKLYHMGFREGDYPGLNGHGYKTQGRNKVTSCASVTL